MVQKRTMNYGEKKDCMKSFCESLVKHLMEIINFEKKKTIPVTKEQKQSYKKAEHVTFSKRV